MCSLLFLIILVVIVVILYRRGAFTFLMEFMRTKYREVFGGYKPHNINKVGSCEFCGKDNGKINGKFIGACEFCTFMGGNETKEYLDETISESGEYNNSKFTNCMFEAGQKFTNCEFSGRNMITGDSTFIDCNGAGEIITTGAVKISGGTYETVEHAGDIEMKSADCTHIKICGGMSADSCTFGSIDIWGEADGCTEDAKVKLVNCKYEKINAPVDKEVADLLEEINELTDDADNADNVDAEVADTVDTDVANNVE